MDLGVPFGRFGAFSVTQTIFTGNHYEFVPNGTPHPKSEGRL